MHLVEVFLPLRYEDGTRIPVEEFASIRQLLLEAHGGLTDFSRTPAKGLWKPEEAQHSDKDDIVVFEVMTENLDRAWWSVFRQALESRLRQERILIRAQQVEVL